MPGAYARTATQALTNVTYRYIELLADLDWKKPAVVRLVKNGARFAAARWEKPVRPEWWGDALLQAGFVAVSVEPLPHEGGIASAKKPL